MKRRPSFKDFKRMALRDKKFKAEYEALRPEFELMEEFIKARKQANLSQVQLAERLHMQQPAIARLEHGGYSKSSIEKLSKYARAIGFKLKISLVQQKRAS